MSPADAARVAGCHPRHLSDLVSNHLGYPLRHYLQDLRVSAGKGLIEESDLSIAEIARAVGYTHSTHFTRAFVSVMGITPRAHRQRTIPD